MRTQILIILALLLGVSELRANTTDNVNKSGIILDGYDVVTYFKKNSPQKGDAKFKTEFEGSTYLFASDENKQEFLKTPQKYVPAYGGWCAYAVAEKQEKVEIDPKSYIIQDGRLLLFYNGFWGDTRAKWLKDDKDFLKKADTFWPTVKNKEP